MKYNSIVFDVDGTLIESLPDILTALNETLQILGIDRHIDYDEGKSLLGEGPLALMKKTFPDKGLEYIRDIYKKTYYPLYEKHQGETTYIFKGLKEVLDKIKYEGVKIYVATNKPEKLANVILSKTFGDNYFEGILGFNEKLPRKPSKEYADRMKELFNLNDSFLYVGDCGVDVELAKNANCDFCLVRWGYGNLTKELEDEATYVVSKPEELEEIIK